MKKVTLFMISTCPYCKKAIAAKDKLCAENEPYNGIEFEMIDERVHPDIADQYDYFYVPTFYVGDEKVHEGPADETDVKAVFEAALEH